MLVARHAHHLYDGAMIVMRFPRPTHIVVGLDWAADAKERARMEWACRAAEYPIVLRTPTLGKRAAYRSDEQPSYTRAALAETTRLLCAGRQLLIFPEGYPNVDPVFSQKHDDDEMLAFEPGFVRFAEAAQRAGAAPVALVPVGIAYTHGADDRYEGIVRCGPAYYAGDKADRAALVAAIEADVRRLSGLA
jgi:putative membrane protein